MNRDTKYFDINIDTGGDFFFTFTVYEEGSTPVDLTGAIVSAKLREYPEGEAETAFTCTHNNDGGQITISLPHETTATLGYTYGRYDVKVTFPDTSVEEILHGKAFIVASVSRLLNPGTVYQIVAFENFDAFPLYGNIYRIYLDQSNYNLYWWNGEQYVSLTYAMKGDAATIRIGTVTTLAPGSNATVENVGTSVNAIFNFGIPQGDKGDAATVEVDSVVTAEPGTPASVVNVGTEYAAKLKFTIPRGYTGFVQYAVFDVDLSTGDLMMYSDADYTGANFRVNADGDLEVII